MAAPGPASPSSPLEAQWPWLALKTACGLILASLAQLALAYISTAKSKCQLIEFIRRASDAGISYGRALLLTIKLRDMEVTMERTLFNSSGLY